MQFGNKYLPEFSISRITIVLALVSFFINLLSSFTQISYDWDLDHELYFGQRLLQGELIWTKEFHDKLPFQTFLFAIPSVAGGLVFWRVFSALLLCITLFYLFRSLHKAYVLFFSSARKLDLFRNILAVTVINLGNQFLFLPGGISHTNLVPVCFLFLSIILHLNSSRCTNVSNKLLIQYLSTIFGAMSVSSRPYLFSVFVLFSS
jgi:hypothetical protein